jgi:predicted porin
MRKAALYLRVSTQDQTTANQERELRAVADRMGCEIVHVYRDHGVSGAKGRDQRPQFDKLCRDTTLNEYSLYADYHFTKRFDVYAGIAYSEVTGGLEIAIPHGPGVPYYYNNNIAPTVGVRYTF